MTEHNKIIPVTDCGVERIDRDLRALYEAVQSEPASDELKRLVRELENQLKNQGTN